MGVGCGLAHKRRKTSPCPQTGLRKGSLPLFPLFPPILSWRCPCELLFFMEFACFLVHYRSCYYQDHRHFFWGISPAPSLPTGSCIVHPPDFIYVNPGKEFSFTWSICWVGSPSPNLSTSCCRDNLPLPVISFCSLSVGKCSQDSSLAPTPSQVLETPSSFPPGRRD